MRTSLFSTPAAKPVTEPQYIDIIIVSTKNSGRVPHGGWSFIPGREKLSQQAHRMTVRQELFYTPVL